MKREFKNLFQEVRKGRFKFSDRAYIFFFCLLLSTFFWFLSALSEEYTTDLTTPLKYNSISDDFILTETPPKSLKIKVRGSGFELLGEQMSLDRREVMVDLSEANFLSTSSQYYILSNKLTSAVKKQLDQDLSLINIKPDTLFLKTQSRLSKYVPVKPEVDLTFEEGYQQRGEIKVEPDSVMVSGPKSFIDTLKSLTTSKIVKNSLKDSLIEEIALQKPSDIKGVTVEPSRVKLLIPTEKFTEKALTLEVEISHSKDGELIKTFPNQVKVSLLVPLSKYNNLDVNLLKAVVDLNDLRKEKKKLNVKIEGVPQYAKLIRVEPDRLEYIIRK